MPELAEAVWLAVEEVDPRLAEQWEEPAADPSTPAFLQYTSGSTALPKGVIVTHGNILHNEAMIRAAFGQSEESVIVGWLPLYHDMGLIGNVLQPLAAGATCVLMPPLAFLQRPVRWLQAIHRYRATTSGGPDFAYDLCVRKVGPEQRAGLDLSSWKVAFNGAEPVRAETLDRFAEAFAPCGFRREAFYPCYGLAEATLFVAGGRLGEPPVVGRFAAAGLERGEAIPSPASRAKAGCWSAAARPGAGSGSLVADPGTGEPLAPGQVGEIWVAGPSVAAGYWSRPEETARTFRARLAGDSGQGDGPFLRTGDLGFVRGGELFVTGRLKDLIILRGRNHYPQDIERTAEQAHPELEPGGAAAFSVDVAGEERLVIAHEVGRRFARSGVPVAQVAAALRLAVAEEHEVQVHEVVLLRTGTLPRTSSGKVQRHACRAAWLAGGAGLGDRGPRRGGPRAAAEAVPEAGPALDPRGVFAALSRGARSGAWRSGCGPSWRGWPGWMPPAWRAGTSPASAGLDSLMAVELGHRLEGVLGVAVAPARWLEARSLDELAAEIGAELEAPASAEEKTPCCGRRGLPLCPGDSGASGSWSGWRRRVRRTTSRSRCA